MIIVSLTTLPGRLDTLEPLLQNLSSQSHLPDKIVLYLPSVYKRFPACVVTVPAFFSKYHNVEIHRCCDSGPITKLLPALKEFTGSSDVIITVDDDVLLERHAIEELLSAHQTFSQEEYPPVLGFMGVDNGQFYHAEVLQYTPPVSQTRMFKEITNGGLGGYRGVLYPRKSIPDDIFDIYTKVEELHKDLPYPMMDDDHFISHILHRYQRKILVIGTFYPGNLQPKSIYELINIKITPNTDGVSATAEKIGHSRELINQVLLGC